MDNNETQFLESVWCKEGKYDFIVCNLNVNASGLVEFFNKNQKHIEANNGYISIEVLRAKKDRSKLYAKFTPYTPKPKVEADEHLPDRNKKPPVDTTTEEEKDGLPF